MRKSVIAVLICATIVMGIMLPVFAQQKTIVFVSKPNYPDPATGEHSDQPFIDELVDLGYNVITFYNTSLSTASTATLDTLNNADLVIIGRSVASNDFQDPNKEAWNDVIAPMILLQLWAARSNRLNWFNTETCLHYNDIGEFYATVNEPDDPVFGGLYSQDEEILWSEGAYDVIDTQDPGNGITLVTGSDNTVQFVRFEADVEFYVGAGDYPAGPRSFIGNGNDNPTNPDTGDKIFNYYNFSEEARQIYLNEVALMSGAGISAVKDSKKMAMTPQTYMLGQNYPNPFNPSTRIQFSLGKAGYTSIRLYDITGQLIETLVEQHLDAGSQEIIFNASQMSSGTYFYKIQSGNFTDIKKMNLIK